jgi:hypothetical protein
MVGEDITRGPDAGRSGWITTKVAARSLRVDPRTVRKYIKQGKLEAKAEGEGVEKTYLVSVDSLHELLGTRPDPRVARDEVPPESAGSAATADLVELVRDLSGEVTRRASEAAELRTKLELTERAESSQREALNHRLEMERLLREQAERERDELAARLEALQETRDATEKTTEDVSGTSTPSPDAEELRGRSSWWRRFFGFE